MGSYRDVIGFFNWPNPSSHTVALGSTQPLTEMSTRNLPGGKGRPARMTDNLTAVCEPIVWKMWEPRRVTTLWAFTACYRDSFTFFFNSCKGVLWISNHESVLCVQCRWRYIKPSPHAMHAVQTSNIKHPSVIICNSRQHRGDSGCIRLSAWRPCLHRKYRPNLHSNTDYCNVNNPEDRAVP
jgi:hypothetical protein